MFGLQILILIVSVLAGAAAIAFSRLGETRNLKLLTAFSGAYLIGLTCLHLMPEVFASTKEPHWQIGAFILAGFFVQIILENFSRGLEHGHSHPPHGPLPYSMLMGLCIHAFLEATPLGADSHAHAHAHDHLHEYNPSLLLAAIAIHKFPVAIVLLAMLQQSGITKSRVWILFGIFAVMAPLGALAGNLPFLAGRHHWLLAIVIGIFMHVSTTILFESEEGHRVNRQKGIAIALGAILAAGTVAFSTHQH
ncbi:MAG: hypothetical protein CMO74_02120 [Verrucomicrobiales bacterium]|nr:hypothetical protein [Verrucomicrobiales bacterium]|tara:strand:- start:8417 stop:9166 length:750 start_codon:yes stop_codon:yes gene_type:complete